MKQHLVKNSGAFVIIGLIGALALALGQQVCAYRRGVELTTGCSRSLVIGGSDADLNMALAAPGCAELDRWRVRQDGHDFELLKSPLVFGAANWVLYVELLDGRVSAIRIRTEDSRKVRPAGAPQDREAKLAPQGLR